VWPAAAGILKMILKIDIKDKAARPRGSVRIRLDCDQKRSSLEEDA
jgi:hypothetical protein